MNSVKTTKTLRNTKENTNLCAFASSWFKKNFIYETKNNEKTWSTVADDCWFYNQSCVFSNKPLRH